MLCRSSAAPCERLRARRCARRLARCALLRLVLLLLLLLLLSLPARPPLNQCGLQRLNAPLPTSVAHRRVGLTRCRKPALFPRSGRYRGLPRDLVEASAAVRVDAGSRVSSLW